jgi:xanthine dehydrogenase accessory factor
MVIRGDGSILGTIGGGMLEAQVRDTGMRVLRETKTRIVDFIFTNEDAAGMGMICGGRVQVMLQFIDASQHFSVEFYLEILKALSARKRAWLITEIPSDECAGNQRVPCLLRSDGTSLGYLDQGDVKALTAIVGSNQAELIAYGEKRFLVESLCHEGTVYIFGAGHISRELAPLTRHVGFQTIVLDDRGEFANRDRFASADEIIVLDSFDQVLDGLEINEDSYLVLVTRGHAHDKTVLAQVLRTNAGYIGMIGSRKKRDAIYDALHEEGFPPEAFKRVRSPIGLDIGAETPEEIAVSILAELILARVERNR